VASPIARPIGGRVLGIHLLISPQPSDRDRRRPQVADNELVDMTVAERILDMVAAVPAGHVATYGDIAARAGTPSPRLVGRVLAELSDEDTPWHRIVRANGTPAAHLLDEQCQRLRSEGVEVIGGRVDLRRFRFRATR
jgi:alkylated DNA nucleotide flippase Atl1